MILGIGNDIIEIERIEKAIKKSENFKNRVFTKNEIEYAEKHKVPYFSFAGRFAVKEAVAKAFGTGIRGFSLKDIEVKNDELGKPSVILYNELKKSYDGCDIHITITHNKTMAMATAILERK